MKRAPHPAEASVDSSAARSTLHVALRRDIWRIWLNGSVFGDYASKEQAVETAEAAKRVMAAIGKAADVVVAPD